MSVLYIMIPVSIGLAILFVGGFIWASNNQQFDDLSTPAFRMLKDDHKGEESK